MNKTFLTIAVLALLTLFTSAYYSAPADSRIGYKAPSLALGNNNGLSPLQQHYGENILLTFWASSDADSRLDNMRYDRISRNQDMSFTHISVNMDRSESVFDCIVALDDLNRSSQFNATVDAQDEIIKRWRLDDGYHSFLIDAKGKIIAVDPDAKSLSALK